MSNEIAAYIYAYVYIYIYIYKQLVKCSYHILITVERIRNIA